MVLFLFIDYLLILYKIILNHTTYILIKKSILIGKTFKKFNIFFILGNKQKYFSHGEKNLIR